MFKNIIIVLFILVLCQSIEAQQDPQFTQYTYNMSIVNPAYATNQLGVLNLGANYRKQWVKTIGSPRTLTFFAHTPFNNKIETGLTFTQDEIGEDIININESTINADFAYILDLNTSGKLSLGLKAGFSLFDTNFSGVLIDDDDPIFSNNVNEVYPTVGLGAYYFTNSYYVGFSTPNLIRSTQLDNGLTIERLGREEIHFYMIGGYVFTLNDTFKLKPSFMVRGVKGAPYNFDLSLNALIHDRIEAGVSYRVNDAISAIAGFRISPSLKVAYSYDQTVSGFSNYNNGSHEIVVLFDVSLLSLKKGYKKSPRFF